MYSTVQSRTGHRKRDHRNFQSAFGDTRQMIQQQIMRKSKPTSSLDIFDSFRLFQDS